MKARERKSERVDKIKVIKIQRDGERKIVVQK